MMSLRYIKQCKLCIGLIFMVMSVVLLLFGVTVTPIFAKEVDTLDKHVTSPVRLALTHLGDLLLSDYQSQSVLVIDPLTLSVKRKIKVKGHPTGVASNGGLIYVGNESTGNVEVYNSRGKLKMSFGSGEIELPNDIEIDHSTGQIFVVDAKADHVLVFDSKGQNVEVIPAPGVVELLVSPTALTIDPKAQLIYVSDQGSSANNLSFKNRNALVRIYHYDGSYVGTLSGTFSRPQGLTINPDGYLYLADGMLGQVLVFDLLSKSLVKTIGSPGTDVGQLSLPLDIAINPDTGDLMVANNRAGRLEIFAGGGVAP